MLKVENISKIYKDTNSEILNNINITFPNKGLVYVTGDSQSGKTTLLNILGCITTPTSGKIYLDNKELGIELSFDEYRRNIVDVLYKDNNLLDDLNVFDNISLNIIENKIEKTKEVLNIVGLDGYENKKINSLTILEKQKVAIARFLASNKKILLLDEPTENLDSKSIKKIDSLLSEISKDKLVIIFTYDDNIASYSNSIIKLDKGIIIKDSLSIDDGNIYTITKRKISFSSMFKYSLTILFSNKIRTIISIIISSLTMALTAFAVISSTYDCNEALAKTIYDDNIYLENAFYNTKNLKDLDSIIPNDKYLKCYSMSVGNMFIVNEYNEGILDYHSFYCKYNLVDGYAYVTDYYLDKVVNEEKFFTEIEYKEYNDAIGKKIYYKDELLFRIAGVIKTNYKDYYPSYKESKVKDNYESERYYNHDLEYLTRYRYNVCYLGLNTFNNLPYDNTGYYFNSNKNSKINVICQGEEYTLNEIISDGLQNCRYIDENGNYRSIYNVDYALENGDINRNDVVISSDLYNIIFNVNLDWLTIDREASNGTSIPIPYIGKTIELCIESDGFFFKDNVNIIGVSPNTGSSIGKYKIFRTKDLFHVNNDICYANHLLEIDWKNINNKYEVLNKLKDRNIWVYGLMADDVFKYRSSFNSIGLSLLPIAFFLLIIISLICYNLIKTKLNKRNNDIGILYRIGYSKKETFLVFIIPICIIAIITIILGFFEIGIINFIINEALKSKPYENIKYLFINWKVVLSILGIDILLMFISSISILCHLKKKGIKF